MMTEMVMFLGLKKKLHYLHFPELKHHADVVYSSSGKKTGPYTIRNF